MKILVRCFIMSVFIWTQSIPQPVNGLELALSREKFSLPGFGSEDWMHLSGKIVKVDATNVQLREVRTVGDGSCGYRAMDIDRTRAHQAHPRRHKARSRQDLIRSLIDALGDETKKSDIIRLITPEIIMFNPDNIPQITKIAGYDAFCELVQLCYEERGPLINRVQTLLESYYGEELARFFDDNPCYNGGIPLDDLCWIVDEIAPDEESDLGQAYMALQDNMDASSKNMIDFCSQEEVVHAYLDCLLANNQYMELPQQSVYGLEETGIPDAIASLQGVKLVIVDRNNGEILHESEEYGEDIVYLIYNGRNHYTRGIVLE